MLKLEGAREISKSFTNFSSGVIYYTLKNKRKARKIWKHQSLQNADPHFPNKSIRIFTPEGGFEN